MQDGSLLPAWLPWKEKRPYPRAASVIEWFDYSTPRFRAAVFLSRVEARRLSSLADDRQAFRFYANKHGLFNAAVFLLLADLFSRNCKYRHGTLRKAQSFSGRGSYSYSLGFPKVAKCNRSNCVYFFAPPCEENRAAVFKLSGEILNRVIFRVFWLTGLRWR